MTTLWFEAARAAVAVNVLLLGGLAFVLEGRGDDRLGERRPVRRLSSRRRSSNRR
jgi:hypothetical protein